MNTRGVFPRPGSAGAAALALCLAGCAEFSGNAALRDAGDAATDAGDVCATRGGVAAEGVVGNVMPIARGYFQPRGAVLDAAGRAYVFGARYGRCSGVNSGYGSLTVLRVIVDAGAARIDTTYGTGDGVACVELPGAPRVSGYALGGALDAEGRLVIAGGASPEPPRGLLARFDVNGRPDATFGDGGLRIVEPPSGYAGLRLWDIVQDPSGGGRLLLVGGAAPDFHASPGVGVVGRILANGAPDPTFGEAGLRVDPSSSDYTAVTVADGDLYFATNEPDTRYFRVVRTDARGTPRDGFGRNGIAERATRVGGTARGVLVAEDGTVTAFGSNRTGATPHEGQLVVARWTSGGALDARFGVGGVAILASDFLASSQWNRAATLGCDGALLVGTARVASSGYMGDLTRVTREGLADARYAPARHAIGLIVGLQRDPTTGLLIAIGNDADQYLDVLRFRE